MNTEFSVPGAMTIGCNYWASHAGTEMWRDWREDVVTEDFLQLAKSGLTTLRVFPIWPDFQPLQRMYGAAGAPRVMLASGKPLGHDLPGAAGMDPVMMERFATLCGIAEAHGLKLIVGLVTGWMSGRMYVPAPFENRNVLTDPEAVCWQVRFVRAFVRSFRNSPAILAWDLGNECNCMGLAETSSAAWNWTNAISSAIRTEDSARAVISGMHGLRPGSGDIWRIQDQAELTDVLTTHPYPAFTPHCAQDPIHDIRNTLHATAECRYYADIGGKPCFAEEFGTLGPMNASEDVAAAYLRTVLWSLWANDCPGLLWWCAYDQEHLEHPPYEWNGWERELGLLRASREPKPAMRELSRFAGIMRDLPPIPGRLTEAVCILTEGQDSWGVAYAAFILAKQAGFDLRFCYVDQPIPDAELYLLPCVTGDHGLPRSVWHELIRRTESGATLYVSHADAVLQPFRTIIGADVHTRQARPDDGTVSCGQGGKAWTFPAPSSFRLNLATCGATVIGTHANGDPAFLHHPYGKGEVYFVNGALENAMSTTPGAFQNQATAGAWEVYITISRKHRSQRVLRKTEPAVSVTEHPVSADTRLLVLVNQTPRPSMLEWNLAPGWEIESCCHGTAPEGGALPLPGNDAAVLIVRQQATADKDSG